MALGIAKQLLPNQHDPLHFIYGNYDCCLCKAELEIRELKNEIVELRKQLGEHLMKQEPKRQS